MRNAGLCRADVLLAVVAGSAVGPVAIVLWLEHYGDYSILAFCSLPSLALAAGVLTVRPKQKSCFDRVI